MKGLALVFGGPKGGKKPAEGPPAEEPAEGGGMDGARKDAAAAVAKALGVPDADVDSLDSALQAFVEACQDAGYSDKE